MRSPLKPLLCRHEFYWSERHGADRCHRCGKTRVADEPAGPAPQADIASGSAVFEPEASFAPDVQTDSGPITGPMDSAFFDIPPAGPLQPAVAPPMHRTPSAKVLKAQAQERRENLLALLDRIAEGGQPSRRDSLDVLMAVIEDAHSADPVLFGSEAAGHFAKLHEARTGLIF